MSIHYYNEEKLFCLDAGEMTCAFAVTEHILMNRFWGAKLNRADIPDEKFLTERRRIGADLWCCAMFDEYPGWNSAIRGSEPSLKVTFEDGTRDVWLEYEDHSIEDDTLTVRLADKKYGLEVRLIYRVYDDCGIIERCAVITNRGQIGASLEIFNSGMLHLPYRDAYRLTTLTGKWSEEYRITHEKIRDGQTVLQTRNIMSGPEAVPFFAIDEGAADERRGGVWFGTLMWSGTHRIIVERGVFGDVSISAGINPFDCQIHLEPGESFTTPSLVYGFTEGGFGAMSRHIHAFERRHVMSKCEAARIMPVVYNAYGTFYGNVNEEKIRSIIPVAHELGIEALIIDAGWSGEGDLYQKGMGDWNQNAERFPHGLRAISDELHRHGMIFGLWMEPECVHPESELFKAHPDWVFGYPERGAELDRMRYVLNFAIDEVRDYMTDKIIGLIENCGVDYFKIDFNRYLYSVGTAHFAMEDKKAVWVKYVENLSRCYLTVKERFPNLLFENCAGGGMRTDLAMLRFAGRINRSDNQDPLDILKIHEGFSYFMLPKLAGGGCHISDVYTRHHNNRTTPMKYQAEIAMMGSLAVGKNLACLSDAEKSELKGYIETYKSLRESVHLGDIYRLASAYEKPYAAFEYLYGDEGVLFVLGQSQQFMILPEPIRLDGLEDESLYEVDGFGIRSGRALMKLGVKVKLEGDFDSRVIRFKKIKERIQ